MPIIVLCSSQKFSDSQPGPLCALLPTLHGREVLVRMTVGAQYTSVASSAWLPSCGRVSPRVIKSVLPLLLLLHHAREKCSQASPMGVNKNYMGTFLVNIDPVTACWSTF